MERERFDSDWLRTDGHLARVADDASGCLFLSVFLVNEQGNIRNIYSSATLDPRLVLADVRTLAMARERSPLVPVGER